jgi:hypothetical protein
MMPFSKPSSLPFNGAGHGNAGQVVLSHRGLADYWDRAVFYCIAVFPVPFVYIPALNSSPWKGKNGTGG